MDHREQEQTLLGIGALVEQSAHIPDLLRSRQIWLAWRYEHVKGRQTKVPYNVRTGGKASSTDPSSWTDFDAAVRALQGGGYNGLGIGISGDIAAIDIDHCVDKYGNLSDMAQDIVDRMDSYTETSPSGTGVRIIFTAPGFLYDKARFYINNQRAGLEVYIAGCTNKYVTITGKVLRDAPVQERSVQAQGVLEAHMKRPGEPIKQEHTPKPAPAHWQAAGESIKTSIRVRERQMQMLQEGVYRGGLVSYGYNAEFLGRINKKGHPVRDLVINQEEAKLIERIEVGRDYEITIRFNITARQFMGEVA